ncbi:M15 family metallopeptidase [Nocardia aurantiaca]|uniref:Peptidase M15 n=1 Tax=Nocardia aurantiaca TaxID=2675850 RepID=A0A6I3KYD0_9NOCA|nr:M15 family metallopeptidase [Nocardia aurantiaca]MTE14441.1 peptidase M15 [Nocardia aurantiaca]
MPTVSPDPSPAWRRPHGTRRAAAVAVLASAGLVGGSLAVVSAAQAAAQQLSDSTRNGEGVPTAKAIAAGTDGLDPHLAAAYSAAADEAHNAGVSLWITSGYRTPAEQEALWEDGLQTYGSPDAARRWVLPPNESTHVTGRAIDVGPQEGAAWLEANGNHWGLCRMYDNEWWHFELATAPDAPCPARLPDASDR